MNKNKEETDKTDIILQQWQTCVEMANSVSQRRDTMNNLFVTINIGLIAAISFIWDWKSLFACVSGIAVCIVWVLFIQYYKKLNDSKFQVINTMEKKLPEQPFNKEWSILEKKSGIIRGTKLETILPILFIVLYIAAIITISIITITAKSKGASTP